ncbi:winged helix-turn-helix domain-containing protein [Naasia sp. SYSU D00057]|uniref:winged helix-turn-helix domain-containing protein n=1 Tax=Naasia sp. SYSU D00057 TaxID=2817380 RepID=UPI001B309C34|nr:winged helix-turn-helix domain-containing protein [Naasia sp. SYSU D00057]
MSLATLPTASRPTAPRTAAPRAEAPAPRLRAVPEGTEVRGFVLYVGVDEAKTAAAGTDLAALVEALRSLTTELVPGAQTHAAVALAPRGAGGRDVDVVRLALQDPSALASRTADAPSPDVVQGVVIDLSRKRVLLDEETAPLTYKEFELLQYLVLREGRTVARAEIIAALWPDQDADAPNERTIDVHVRRLRSKLGDYQDIVRTVRGTGYRFDRHADVVVRHDLRGPSPDL